MNTLQFKIRQRRFEKQTQRVMNLRLLHFSKEKTFDKIQHFIVAKHVQRVYGEWLKSITLMFGLSPADIPTSKELLSAYMIHAFPDDVIGKTRNPLESKMIEIGTHLVYLIHGPASNKYHKLLRALSSFHTHFKCWLKNDKQTQLDILADMYYSVSKTKQTILAKQDPQNEHPKPMDIKALDDYMSKIRKQAMTIAGEKGCHFIDIEYPKILHLRQNMLSKTVDAIAKKAFWDTIAVELSQKPPHWHVVVSLIKEIKQLLLAITKRDEEEMNDVLNIELIERMIKYDVFNLQKIVDLILYIVDKIQAYGPPSQDESISIWKESVLATLKKETPTDMAQFIPRMFAEIMERLTSIGKASALMKRLLNV